MPLIFAIDSDKRQSAQLASLLRSHVEADLVQSASAVEGLEILKGRVPDLILTSSLLSPRDETALDSYLRELGVAAAHVQTLTIPVIAGASASGSKKKKPAGMLAKLRGEKKSAAKPSGCDPDVFANEVQLYLGRAIEQREALRAVLPADVPAPVVEAEVADSLTAAAPSVEPAVEPPTVVMLAPTVLAVVVKQPREAQPETILSAPEPEPLPPGMPEAAGPFILAEPAAEPAPALSIFSVLRDSEPEAEPVLQPELAPIDLHLVTPAVEPIAEPDAVEELLAVPAATVEAAEQLLVAPVSILEPEPLVESEPVVEPELLAQAAPETTLELATEPTPDSWSFDASREESAQLDRLLQRVVEDADEAQAPSELSRESALALTETTPVVAIEEPKAAEAVDAAPPPDGLAPAEFAELLAPPPTRIADAIRMPEVPVRVPTVDMLECRDLDTLADDFAAAGLTAELPQPPAAAACIVEPVIEPVVEPLVEAMAVPEVPVPPPVADATPVLEAVEETVEAVAVVEVESVIEVTPIIEDLPVVETASIVATVEPPPAIEAQVDVTVAEVTVAEVPVADVLIAEIAAVEVRVDEMPVVELPVAEAPAETPTPIWSWLEEKAPSLADLLSTRLGSAPTPEEPFPPAIETPALVEVFEETVLVEEVYDAEAAASWNLAATVPSVEDRSAFAEQAQEPAPVQAMAVEPMAAAIVEPPSAEEPVAVAETAAWDPISAAAWQSAVAPAPPPAAPAASAPAEPAQAAAPDPDPDPGPEPPVDEAPAADVPMLDAEVLAMLGMAVHRAGLEALETLDAPDPEPPRAAGNARPGRRRARQDRQSRSQRRDTRNGRKARPKEDRPAQDEWGIFDPAQCGPEALFDDEEWTDDDDRPSRSRATTY
jgi:hypothetical protein